MRGWAALAWYLGTQEQVGILVMGCELWARAVDGARAFLHARATVRDGSGRESCLVLVSLPPLPFWICPLSRGP